MKSQLYFLFSIASLALSAQQAYIGNSTVELTTYNSEAAIVQEVSMPFGYKSSCPKIVKKEITENGSALSVRVEYDAVGFNLACGCTSQTTILLNGYTVEDLRKFDRIELSTDVRFNPNGIENLFRDEDVQVLYRSGSMLNTDFYKLNDAWVYPNPAVNVLNLEIPTSVDVKDIYVTSGNGTLIGRIQASSRVLDLQGYAAGQYYVWIVGSTDRVVRSFVVAK